MDSKEHPALFRGPMVCALLDGTKTLTSRVIRRYNTVVDGHSGLPYGAKWEDFDFENAYVDPGPSPAGNLGPYLKVPLPREETVHRFYPRWQVGDVVWVKENWRPYSWDRHEGWVDVEYQANSQMSNPIQVDSKGREWIRERLDIEHLDNPADPDNRRWHPSIFMPKWMSRIKLKVTDIHIRRVQDTHGIDALREGIGQPLDHHWEWFNNTHDGEGWECSRCGGDRLIELVDAPELWGEDCFMETNRLVSCPECKEIERDRRLVVAQYQFQELWDSINVDRGFGWSVNPWCYCFSVKRIDKS